MLSVFRSTMSMAVDALNVPGSKHPLMRSVDSDCLFCFLVKFEINHLRRLVGRMTASSALALPRLEAPAGA